MFPYHPLLEACEVEDQRRRIAALWEPEDRPSWLDQLRAWFTGESA